MHEWAENVKLKQFPRYEEVKFKKNIPEVCKKKYSRGKKTLRSLLICRQRLSCFTHFYSHVECVSQGLIKKKKDYLPNSLKTVVVHRCTDNSELQQNLPFHIGMSCRIYISMTDHNLAVLTYFSLCTLNETPKPTILAANRSTSRKW